jgi:hypothetical protein
LLTGCGGGDAPEAAATTEPTVADAQAEPTTVSVAPTTADVVTDPQNGLDFFEHRAGATKAAQVDRYYTCDDFTALSPGGISSNDEATCLTRTQALQYQESGTLPAGITEADLIDPLDDNSMSSRISYKTQIGLNVMNRSLENFRIASVYDALGSQLPSNRFFVNYTLNGQDYQYEEEAGTVYSNTGSQGYLDGTTEVRVYNFDTGSYEVLISPENGDTAEGDSKLKALLTRDGDVVGVGDVQGGINFGTVDMGFNSPEQDSPYVDANGDIFFSIYYDMGDSVRDQPVDRLELDKRGQLTSSLPSSYGFDDFETSTVNNVGANDTVRYSTVIHEDGWNSTLENFTLTDSLPLGPLAGNTLQNTITADYEKLAGTPGNFSYQQFSKTDTVSVNVTQSNLEARYVPGSTRVYDKDYNPVNLPQLGGGNVIPDITVNGETVSALMDPNGYIYNLDPYNPEANYLQGCLRFIRHIEYEVEFVPQAEPDINSEE